MSIPEHKIDEVLQRVDLVGLVSRHVELKKAGRSFKGRCPFHQEKTPSFHVTPEMRRFKCFGCQAGGDAIAFVQRYFGKTFVDAVRDLAREVGVDLEGAEDPGVRERQQLKEATDLAAEHFRTLLWAEEGRRARAYLLERGLDEDTLRTFGLGWAPGGWTGLSDKLREAGMLEWGVQAGLVSPRPGGEGYYDFFRSRVMIPIRSPEGRTIAFGGRLVDSEEGPKYLNSKESRLYSKGDTLYALDRARDEVRRRRAAVLVEGYFDAIGLHQVGVRHTVALCSTALTPGHLAVLARAEARELVLLLDGDEAGLKAVERLAASLLAAGTPTRVALLPQGDDPDTFARREGAAGVERLVSVAQPLTTHLFGSLLPEGRQAGFEEKMAALSRLKGVAAGLPVGLVRSAFFGAMAEHFGLPAVELEAELRGRAPPARPVPRPGAAPGAPLARPRPPARPPEPLEALYVAASLREPGLVVRDRYRVLDELAHSGLRRVLDGLLRGAREDALFEADEATKRALDVAASQLPSEEAALTQAFETVCGKLKLRRLEEQLSHIARVTGQLAGGSELSDEVRALMTQRVELLALRRRVHEEMSSPASGTKDTMQPV